MLLQPTLVTAMPHKIAALRVEPLDTRLRKSSQIGAEVILPDTMNIFDPQALTQDDTDLLREGLFDHGVLVIRNQLGVDPQVLCDIAKLFDPQAQNVHSGGKTQITDPKNILSQNNCSRIQRAPQVSIIGQGRIEEYEGIPLLQLKHLVCGAARLSKRRVTDHYRINHHFTNILCQMMR